MAALAQEFMDILDHSIEIQGDSVHVINKDVFRKQVYRLAEISALGTGARQGYARFITRAAGIDLGVYPASINDLYMARGRGEVPTTFSVPAFNMRVLSFDAARAVFRVALSMDVAAMIFEIARSEMNYTDQRPSEYTTSILAGAIAEGYSGPVFIQGDHFQVSSKKYNTDPVTEIEGLKSLIQEALAAGFFNIDIDTSTLVDLSKNEIIAQQKVNVELSAMLAAYIRSVEPKGVSISIGGEIGEVGGHNSSEEELIAYLGGFRTVFHEKSVGSLGLSKISIQTGTSHGGIVLPDGTIAKVSVDFNTILTLGRLAAKEFGLGGAVQHGASTLPEDAFGKFTEVECLEVHLATGFTNMFFDHIPAAFREEIYAYLREKSAAERKPDMTDEQFYYKTRKSAIGPFKARSWNLPAAVKDEIGKAWEDQFRKLFISFNLQGTRKFVEQTIKHAPVKPDMKAYLGGTVEAEDVSDLAD
jgi:fructose/tagatose bisphosphate aldolase